MCLPANASKAFGAVFNPKANNAQQFKSFDELMKWRDAQDAKAQNDAMAKANADLDRIQAEQARRLLPPDAADIAAKAPKFTGLGRDTRKSSFVSDFARERMLLGRK